MAKKKDPGAEQTWEITSEMQLGEYQVTLPRLVDEMNLSPYAYRLYGHMAQKVASTGRPCREGTRKLAEVCRMSKDKVTEAKRELEAAALIVYVERGNREGQTDHITLTDVWPANMYAYCHKDINDAAKASIYRPELQKKLAGKGVRPADRLTLIRGGVRRADTLGSDNNSGLSIEPEAVKGGGVLNSGRSKNTILTNSMVEATTPAPERTAESATQLALIKKGRTRPPAREPSGGPVVDRKYYHAMFKLCFLIANEREVGLLAKKEVGRVKTALIALTKSGQDLDRMNDFAQWWAMNYRSRGRESRLYQPPTPEQVRELWLEAMRSRDAMPQAAKREEDQAAQERLAEAMRQAAKARAGK